MDKSEHWNDEIKTEDDIIWVSKSEMKRDAEALKKLGAELIKLNTEQLDTIPLDANLRDAIELAQRLNREPLRRQLQYIGKLLRRTDATPIYEALAKSTHQHQQQQAMLHKLEGIRTQLIEQGDTAINTLLQNYPQLDRQHLRNLLRAYQREQAQNKPPKSFQEIFQYLKTMLMD